MTQAYVFVQDLKHEQERIRKTNIVVCTPGRLLQHMDETPDFTCNSLQVLGNNIFFSAFLKCYLNVWQETIYAVIVPLIILLLPLPLPLPLQLPLQLQSNLLNTDTRGTEPSVRFTEVSVL